MIFIILLLSNYCRCSWAYILIIKWRHEENRDEVILVAFRLFFFFFAVGSSENYFFSLIRSKISELLVDRKKVQAPFQALFSRPNNLESSLANSLPVSQLKIKWKKKKSVFQWQCEVFADRIVIVNFFERFWVVGLSEIITDG